MGMGKTVSIIVRLLDSKYLQNQKGTTLVVAPKSIISQWEKEIKTCTPDLRVYVHTGTSRTYDASNFENYDVVLTAYGTVRSEHRNLLAMEDDNALGLRTTLFDAQFLRIVMDEGHETRNTKTKLSQACNELHAKYRIVMTGTPIHNKYGDMFSYFSFLRIVPYNDPEHFSELEDEDPEKIHEEFRRITLRRMKSDVVDGEPIMRSEVIVEDIHPNPVERKIYDAIISRIWHTINEYIPDEHSIKRYTCALVMLLRLRQATTHPWLCISQTSVMNDEKDLDHHCRICVAPLEADRDSVFCSHCRKHIVPSIQKVNKRAKALQPRGSSKTDRMLEILREVRDQSGGTDKTVVFSQWIGFVEIVGELLKNAGFAYVRYDGSMSVDAKEAALKRFESDPMITVMLVSFKAGGVGLNLTAANNIILMDLWWNPAMEDQAFDRIRRIGQKKAVKIHKFVVPDTIEIRVVQLQNEKRALINAIFEGNGNRNNGKSFAFDEMVEVLRPVEAED